MTPLLWLLSLILGGFQTEAIGRARYYENGVSQNVELNKNYIVSVRLAEDPKQRLCLGTIINRKLVLTAAHCVVDSKGEKLNVIVVAGTITENFESDPNAVKRNISNIFVHPNYEYKAATNDLAILELSQTLEYFGTNITAAVISDKLPVFPECRVFGYGCDSNKTKSFNRMQSKLLFIYERAKCQRRYGANFYTNEVCADYFGEIFCGKDTGGPLICNNKLVAVVSYLSDQEVYPNLFMLVSRHIGFIHNPVGMLQFYSRAASTSTNLWKIKLTAKWKIIPFTIIFLILYNFILK